MKALKMLLYRDHPTIHRPKMTKTTHQYKHMENSVVIADTLRKAVKPRAYDVGNSTTHKPVQSFGRQISHERLDSEEDHAAHKDVHQRTEAIIPTGKKQLEDHAHERKRPHTSKQNPSGFTRQRNQAKRRVGTCYEHVYSGVVKDIEAVTEFGFRGTVVEGRGGIERHQTNTVHECTYRRYGAFCLSEE